MAVHRSTRLMEIYTLLCVIAYFCLPYSVLKHIQRMSSKEKNEQTSNQTHRGVGMQTVCVANGYLEWRPWESWVSVVSLVF